MMFEYFFFSSRIRHTRDWRDWSSDVCSSDLVRVRSDQPYYLSPLAERLHGPSLGVLGGEPGGRGRIERSDEVPEIGRASCRERVQISVVAVSLKKKQ